MTARTIVTTACAGLIAFAVFQQDTTAMPNRERTTYLTFNQPVRLPGVGLGAGTYIFEFASPDTSANVVRVLSRDRKTAYFLGFTQRVPRPDGLRPDAHVSLSESPRGTPPAITVWWQEEAGHRFVYPQQ